MSLLSKVLPLQQQIAVPLESKFSPASAAVNWQQVQSLIYTLQRSPDYESGGDGNSAVFACLMALSVGSIEPPLSVFKKDTKGKREAIPNSPLQAFLDDPNPDLDMLELRFWTTWAKHLDGNAYLLKVRSGNGRTGNPVELWPISPLVMRPWTEKGSGNFIDYYRYERRPGDFEEIPVENVIHFRLGIDDRDPRKGLSPIKRLIREIASDTEATRFADQLLRNFGIPGLVVELPLNSRLTREERLEMKDSVSGAFGSENRGNVGVLSDGATMKQFGFTPEQLNLQALHNVPEARICAVMGVHPAVAFLNVGLEQSANYASLRVVQEAFTERKLVPLWRMDEAKWNKRLRPDFSGDRSIVIAHDLTEVRALQEDADALYDRLDKAVQTGWILPDEARADVGKPPMPDGTGMQALPKPAPVAAPAAEDGQLQPGQPQKARGLESKAPIDEWPDDLQSLVELAAPGFQRDLQRFQELQQRRVQRALERSGG